MIMYNRMKMTLRLLCVAAKSLQYRQYFSHMLNLLFCTKGLGWQHILTLIYFCQYFCASKSRGTLSSNVFYLETKMK